MSSHAVSSEAMRDVAMSLAAGSGAAGWFAMGVGAAGSVRPKRLVVRQPILDGRREVMGYELLFRGGWEEWVGVDPALDAAELDGADWEGLAERLRAKLEKLVDGRLAFVRCTRDAIVHGWASLLPAKGTVIEIANELKEDDALVSACAGLREGGYTLALDNFLPRREMAPLLESASYLKLDFQRNDAGVRAELARMTRGRHVALVAEDVRNVDEFGMARVEGYEYFQGHFLLGGEGGGEPEDLVEPDELYPAAGGAARRPFNFGEVMRILQSEPTLCYRLLIMANSPLWGIRSHVTSVPHAFMLVGEERFRSLMSVAASCVLGQTQPAALISLALERARFCELAAAHVGENATEQSMLGLLSLVGAMLETSMEAVVKSLPLREEAKQALLGETNEVAGPLRLIKKMECGDWKSCEEMSRELGLNEETVAGMYVESVKWARETLA
jgi:c-di-GMP-related signal transduction protein